jgi:hypothetical protein
MSSVVARHPSLHSRRAALTHLHAIPVTKQRRGVKKLARAFDKWDERRFKILNHGTGWGAHSTGPTAAWRSVHYLRENSLSNAFSILHQLHKAVRAHYQQYTRCEAISVYVHLLIYS